MNKSNEMLEHDEMMDLIIQSVEKSDLFRTEWEREFVKCILKMFLIKGDFVHFIKYYGCKVDKSDFETYFRNTFVKKFNEEFYDEFVIEYYGE